MVVNTQPGGTLAAPRLEGTVDAAVGAEPFSRGVTQKLQLRHCRYRIITSSVRAGSIGQPVYSLNHARRRACCSGLCQRARRARTAGTWVTLTGTSWSPGEAQQGALAGPHRSCHVAGSDPVAAVNLDSAVTKFGDRVRETHLDQARAAGGVHFEVVIFALDIYEVRAQPVRQQFQEPARLRGGTVSGDLPGAGRSCLRRRRVATSKHRRTRGFVLERWTRWCVIGARGFAPGGSPCPKPPPPARRGRYPRIRGQSGATGGAGTPEKSTGS